ncbi:MAG: hypothetical protein GX898_11100 [Corynebacterium sp.]|uniref:hypothetical protein n=1 Tax=uncultured Corynebacterium sp. TaxID=159447 RepID=UPI00183951C0|nr:hypothetical protein [uncultured Corynebacterium sp.]NLZ58821.1 hypothetical protein [Corynebacterium sp.]
MSGFNLEMAAALSSLQKMLGETATQSQIHKAEQPSYPVTAAGRDFGALGAEVAMMFEGLHRSVDKHLAALETTADAATRQVGVYADEDQDFADSLDGVE